MKFNFKNLIVKDNCIEINRKGVIYWRIFVFRLSFQSGLNLGSITKVIEVLNQRNKYLKDNGLFSIEASRNSVIVFYITRESELSNLEHLIELKRIIEDIFGKKFVELHVNDIEKYFWGVFYKNINFSNIELEEKSFRIRLKERTIHLGIFSILRFEIVTHLIELIDSLKIKEFRLYFKNDLDSISKLDLKLSLESETKEKIQEFYAIISNNFPRETITPFIPNKTLFIQYLLKFLKFDRSLAKKIPRYHQLLSPRQFLKKLNFEEVRPFIFIHQKKLVSIIILRKPNLRFIKYYLKTYYPKYFLIFWIFNRKLAQILEKDTKLRSLRRCCIQNKKIDACVWEKALQLNSENA